MATTNGAASAKQPNPIEKALDAVITCRKTISDVLTIRKGKQYVPTIYKQLYFVLLLIELNLARTKDFVNYDGSVEDVDLAAKITNVIESLHVKVEQCTSIVKAVIPALKIPKWKAVFTDASIPWAEPKFKEIGENIMTSQVFMLRAGAPPLSTTEIQEVVQKTSIDMDWRIEEHITDLKAYQRGSISGPPGIPNQVSGLTVSPADVRRPSTFYNVYDARIVGTINTDSGPVPQVIEGVTPKALTAEEEALQRTISRPGPAAIQFESPHLNGIVPTTSVPDMTLLLANATDPDDPARSNSVSSSQLPPPTDPSEAFARVLKEIRNAKLDAYMYPGIALQVYRKALRILGTVQEEGIWASDEVIFLKAHYATICEIGLSRVEIPAITHVQRAETYNEQAFKIAQRMQQPSFLARVTLDKAQIKSRLVKTQEIAGHVGKPIIKITVGESYTLFKKVADSLRGRCVGMEDHHVLAQALLGAGKKVKKLAQWGVTPATPGTPGKKRLSLTSNQTARNNSVVPSQDATAYFSEALKVIEEGINVGRVEGEIDEAIEEMTLLGSDVVRNKGW